jgi:AraC-like DNA-binding protein
MRNYRSADGSAGGDLKEPADDSELQPETFRGVGAGQVRAGAFVTLPAVLAKFGVELAPLLAAAGLPADLLARIDRPIPYLAASRLLALAVQRSGCAHLGLLIGDRAGMSALGPLVPMMRAAPDLQTALAGIVAGLHLHDRGGVGSLQQVAGQASLGYTVTEPEADGVEQIVDLAQAIIARLLREWCGPDWHPHEVRLARRRPAQPARYREIFRCPVYFNAERSEVAFDVRYLRWPFGRAPAPPAAEFERQRAELLALNQLPLPETLRRLLHEALAQRIVSVEDAAARLAVHPRTLNRRLQAEGLNFRRLKAAVQYEAARLLLRATDLPVEEIAAALGYAEVSSFSRSFAAWAGCGPAAWRRSVRHGGESS